MTIAQLQAEPEVVGDGTSEVSGGCDVECIGYAPLDRDLDPRRSDDVLLFEPASVAFPDAQGLFVTEGRSPSLPVTGGRVVAEFVLAADGVEIEEGADAVLAVSETGVAGNPVLLVGEARRTVRDLLLEAVELADRFSEVALGAADLVVDRFHFVMDVIDRVPSVGPRAAELREHMSEERLRVRRYTRDHGDDAPDIRDWTWPVSRRSRALVGTFDPIQHLPTPTGCSR